jgi:uncharacterized protein (DUF433 family)
MHLPDFLTQDTLGSIRLTGHRIGLMHLVHYYNEGYSPEMILCDYPTLSLALIYKIIAFYLENKQELDAYIARCQEEIEQQRATAPRGPSLADLRQRLEAEHRAKNP